MRFISPGYLSAPLAAVLAVGAGCDGQPDSENDPDPEPGAEVRIIRGAEDQSDWLDLTIEGRDLGAPDGTAVILQVGMPERSPERLGSARLTLSGGGFSVHFPQVWEHGLYKQKVVFLDADGDGACSEDEIVLADWAASVEDRTLVATPAADGGSLLWGDFVLADCELVHPAWPLE